MRKIAVLLIFFTLSACSSIKYYKLRNKARVNKSSFLASTPIHFKYHTLSVDIVINGKTYRMILDTGAHTTVISRKLANELNLKVKTHMNVGDSRGNRNELDVVVLDTINIAGVPFTNVSAVVVDWTEGSAISCITPDGIIGNHVLSQCNWLMDFSNKTVTLSDDNIQTDSLSFVEMKYGSSKPHIDIKINGQELKDILFDTGSGGGLDIGQKEGKELFGSLDNAKQIILDGSSEGLYGSHLDTVHVFTADTTLFGDLPVYNMAVDVEKNRRKMGHKYFWEGQIYLNFSDNTIGLSTPTAQQIEKGNKNYPLITNRDSTGLFVANIMIDSEPWNAGLRIGDRIKRAGWITSEASMELDYCSYLSQRADSASIYSEIIIEAEKLDSAITVKAISP